MLRDEPALLGRGEGQTVVPDAVLADAVLGGAGEHLARRWGAPPLTYPPGAS